MPLHMESAALVFVRDDPTFGRGGERSRSANSRVSSDAVSGGNPQRFRDSFREAAPATSATIVQDLHTRQRARRHQPVIAELDPPLRLADAAALAFPHGGMTAAGLRKGGCEGPACNLPDRE